MKAKQGVYLGFDLGAGSGRAVLGLLEKGRLATREIHRFSNGPVKLGEKLYWDFLYLWDQVGQGLRKCAELGYDRLAGVGVDSWGVDFSFIDRVGNLLGNPLCYRDDSTEKMEWVIKKSIGLEKLYQITGMAFSRVGSLAQLAAMRRNRADKRLTTGNCFLMIPDLFRYYLCGHKAVEISSAGSSYLTNIQTRRWSREIFNNLDLPMGMMPSLLEAGQSAGPLQNDVRQWAGLKAAQVIVVPGHDTCSAAAAMPVTDADCAMLICGTWSVLGILRDKPIISREAMAEGFVNELGFRKILFVRNLMGMYLLENLRRFWLRKGVQTTYCGMVREAAKAKPFKAMLDLNEKSFFSADHPELQIGNYLRLTRQAGRLTRGEMIRTVLEGLVWSYRRYFRTLQKLTGRRYKRICMMGGAVRNGLLCQMVADGLGVDVIAGPAEATIAGNLAIQALATGRLAKASDIGDLVHNSFPVKSYIPRATAGWDKNYERYVNMVECHRKF